jgi:6-phosphogluconolactonase
MTGQLEQRHVFGDIRNASYIAVDPTADRLFSTSESVEAESSVHMFRRLADGSLIRLGAQPARGRVACHICVLPCGDVCTPSYLQSCTTVFPVRDGRLEPPQHFYDYQGSGPRADRQEASHAHQVVVAPNGRWYYVVDLGADRIWRHTLDHAAPTGFAAPPGCGPRHMAFAPDKPVAYVLCELNGHVLMFDWDAANGDLRLAGDVSSCPDRPDAACSAIRVHPSGRALYTSDRKDNMLAVFTLDEAGRPTLLKRVSCGGQEPRDFNIDAGGRWLIVGNQFTHHLSVFELNPSNGLMLDKPPRNVPVNSPGCVLFADTPPIN